jgi:hypothetical protein
MKQLNGGPRKSSTSFFGSITTWSSRMQVELLFALTWQIHRHRRRSPCIWSCICLEIQSWLRIAPTMMLEHETVERAWSVSALDCYCSRSPWIGITSRIRRSRGIRSCELALRPDATSVCWSSERQSGWELSRALDVGLLSNHRINPIRSNRIYISSIRLVSD